MQLCDYGCGREARHYFTFTTTKNKWCCEDSYKKCPEVRRKNSKKNKGKIYLKETIRKMREARKGKTHSKETKRKIRKANKGQTSWIKGKTHSEKTRRKLRECNELTIEQIYNRHPTFAKVEEMRYDQNGERQTRCHNHNCPNSKEKDGWFIPTTRQLNERINTVENPEGFGESHFYCSEECKRSCPTYRKTIAQLIKEDEIRAGIIEEETPTGELQIFQKEVLKRQKEELGYNECQYCENKNLEELVVHHEYPRKTHPQFELDPDNGIICCGTNSKNKCHYKYGHKTGTPCSTGELANKICI